MKDRYFNYMRRKKYLEDLDDDNDGVPDVTVDVLDAKEVADECKQFYCFTSQLSIFLPQLPLPSSPAVHLAQG